MFGIAIQAESAAHGVSQLNDGVDVMGFFSTHVLPELQDQNHSLRPMLKSTCVKFVSTFRNQFTTEHLKSLMPLLIAHLSSPMVVVHTYAAFAIEKILVTKESGAGGAKRAKFGAADFQPFLQPLFTVLFTIIDNEQLNENSYVMKCVMRSLNVAHEDVLPLTQVVLERLTAALARVAKNPRTPLYNHYLFESIAVLVRSVCSKNPEATSSFESLLFGPFETVLTMDVSEFTPYVFQILAQLLEYRPRNAGLGDSFSSLFKPLLSPAVWERKANIPASTRLLCAYLWNSGPALVEHLSALLGVFQKLISSKANEVHAYDLLEAVTLYVPPEALQPFLQQIMSLQLTRLGAGKTPRLSRLFSHYSALFAGKYGGQRYFELLDRIQAGLGKNVLVNVWVPSVTTDPPARTKAKAQSIGLTRLLCDSPALLSDPDSQRVWVGTLGALVSLMTAAGASFAEVRDDQDDADAFEVSYDSSFSSLQFAKRPAHDPFPDVADPSLFFAQALQGLSSGHPGRLQPLIEQGLNTEPKLQAGLNNILAKAGVTLA